MLAVLLSLRVHEGKESYFDALMKTLCLRVSDDSSACFYSCSQVPKQSQMRVVFAVYESAADFNRHEAQSYMTQHICLRDQTSDLVGSEFLETLSIAIPPQLPVEARNERAQ